MAEFLLELYSEEIPANLQVSARDQIFKSLKDNLMIDNIKFEKYFVFSCPTRITIVIKDLPIKVKMPSKEIKGPKVGLNQSIIDNFIKSNHSSRENLFEKELDKGKFYFLKRPPRELQVNNVIVKHLLKSLNEISWKKSMKWSSNNMLWGRPLRSIFAMYDYKILDFQFNHLKSSDHVLFEDDLKITSKKIYSSKEYFKLLNSHNILINQSERRDKIIKSFEKISKSHNLLVKSNDKLLDEVVNLVENPSVILADFNRDYLEIPKEIIISTLENHQRYFPCLNKNNEELTNLFVIVANKKDQNNVIKSGNKRVVEARLSDANFFWNRDKSKNLIKQIGNLKKIIFFDGLGNIYDKTQRLRKLGGWLSDELNISKEKVEIAASISKSDLCSELVGEFPDLQGVMGKYFALSQGFEQDVARAISDHYQPVNINSNIPKRPISYSISIVDKIDNLTGFFLINQKPTSSKDPLALRRSAIGLLKTIIHNKLNLKLGNLINLNIRLFEEQGTKIINKLAEKEIIDFLRERMKNILKEKNIKPDIIEASISSHRGDNFFELFNKSILMNKFINKDIGINAINSYKRAFNIIDKIDKEIDGRPDAVLFRKDEEKALFDKINEIRKSLTVKDDHKDFEKLLKNFSETKILTDNFFDKVKVNDDNDDIKNNRLHLLKMFCNTFNSFINFSKLEGVS